MSEALTPVSRHADGVRRVIVIPLSGFVNRLQAMASAAILASEWNAEYYVCWRRQPAADVAASDLFTSQFCDRHVIAPEQLPVLSGLSVDDIRLYLNRRESVLTLAGHDRGEQAFMSEVAQQLAAPDPPSTIILRAGGKFSLPQAGDERWFREQRQRWYRELPLREDITAAAERLRQVHPRSIGLHLRYTDRSHQVPTDRGIQAAVDDVARRADCTSILIASDTPAKRERWARGLTAQGLDPWFAEHSQMDRTSIAGAHGALVDFLLLSGTVGMVYFAESSFGEEAAVASGFFDASAGLAASSTMSALARTRTLMGAAVTYPRRHGWLG